MVSVTAVKRKEYTQLIQPLIDRPGTADWGAGTADWGECVLVLAGKICRAFPRKLPSTPKRRTAVDAVTVIVPGWLPEDRAVVSSVSGIVASPLPELTAGTNQPMS